MSVRVTIGLPFYNARATLADAIRAVFAQTFQDWELLLVDDGSTDASMQVAQAVCDPRVRVITNGRNRGLPYRLNQIAEMASGEFLARMDADDLMAPERIRRQFEILRGDPAIDLVSTGIYSIDSRSVPRGKRACHSSGVSGRGLVAHKSLIHPSVMARTEWFRRNPYDPAYLRSQDYELWCRAFAAGDLRCAKLNEPLYFFREEGSVTLAKMTTAYRMNRRILRAYGPTLAGYGRTAGSIAKTYLKELLYRSFAVFGQEMVIVNRRSSPLSEAERIQALAVIATVLETRLPGRDDPQVTAGSCLPTMHAA